MYDRNDTKSQLIAKYGMLGGITGYNKGSVTLSGTTETAQVFADVHTVDELHAKAPGVVSADQSYIRWESGKIRHWNRLYIITPTQRYRKTV